MYPGVQGATKLDAHRLARVPGLFYIPTWDDYPGIYYSWEQKYESGKWYSGGSVKADLPAIARKEIRTWGP